MSEVKTVTSHVSRHTFAANSITLGIPIEVVSRLLGHTGIKNTMIYAKVVDSAKIAYMDLWYKAEEKNDGRKADKPKRLYNQKNQRKI